METAASPINSPAMSRRLVTRASALDIPIAKSTPRIQLVPMSVPRGTQNHNSKIANPTIPGMTRCPRRARTHSHRTAAPRRIATTPPPSCPSTRNSAAGDASAARESLIQVAASWKSPDSARPPTKRRSFHQGAAISAEVPRDTPQAKRAGTAMPRIAACHHIRVWQAPGDAQRHVTVVGPSPIPTAFTATAPSVDTTNNPAVQATMVPRRAVIHATIASWAPTVAGRRSSIASSPRAAAQAIENTHTGPAQRWDHTCSKSGRNPIQ